MDHKLQQVLLKDARNELFDETEEGIFFPKHGFMLSGEYMDRVNGGEATFTKNLIPKEALVESGRLYLISRTDDNLSP